MIPVVPASGKRGSFTSGSLSFEDGIPVLRQECGLKDRLTDVYNRTTEDDPVILLDVDGFSSRFLNNEIVKEVRVKGRDLLLVTYIENIEDVISALTGSFSGVGIPLNTVDDMDVLADACELSDSVFPVAFMEDGREISTGKDAEEIVSDIGRLCFSRAVFIDTGSCTAGDVQIAPSDALTS